MERIAIIALLMFGLNASAQTPFDSFAPETWRPMLDMGVFGCDEETQVTEQKEPVAYDTILCAAVIDRQEQVLLLVDIESLAVVASAPLTDDLYKWISVDPLVDKNIATSPYMYCNGNPIIYIDPNGEDEWEFDAQGNLLNHIENQYVDILRYMSSNGTIAHDENGMPREIYLPYGSINVQTADNGNTIVVAHGDHAGKCGF